MEIVNTLIKDCYIIKTNRLIDNRGYFERIFCSKELKEFNFKNPLAQINTSYNKLSGTLRGLHLQSGSGSETKIVRCLAGTVWDVVVDLRKNSVTFGKWFGTELNSKDQKMIMVPEGCAHGFITLVDQCELMYFVTNYYQINTEITLNWNDPTIAIKWPSKPIVMSKKDKGGLSFDETLSILNKN